ncbi:MAG TPA: hypothetical protein DCG78_06490 [Anaerolineaceae bacterium]|nr:hypothetical protein [Anaerolineaceae bacterium]
MKKGKIPCSIVLIMIYFYVHCLNDAFIQGIQTNHLFIFTRKFNIIKFDGFTSLQALESI